MFLLPLLAPIILLVLYTLGLVTAQQVGSFFTAIYINGVPASPSQIPCANMGQPNYCCSTGQSCAWDDAGRVACCPSGANCQGYAYGAGAGAGAGQYQSYTSPTTYYQQPQTTTVYQGNGAVVPIVPVTVATVLTPVVAPVSVTTYFPPTSTYTTTPVAEVVVTTKNAACPGGYTTLTMANVGAPVRTVACQIIFNGARRGRGDVGERSFILRLFSLVGMALWAA